MNVFWELLGNIKNYKLYVVLNILSNILMVIFSILSISVFIPFLEILLEQEQLVTEKPNTISGLEDVVQTFYYYLSQIIIEHGTAKALAAMCCSLVGIYFLKNVFKYFSLFFMAPVRNGIVRDIRRKLYDKTLELPLSFFSEQKKGDLISRVSVDVQEIQWSILSVLEVIFRAPLMVVGSLFMMIWLSKSLTLFVLVLLVITIVVMGLISRTLRSQSDLVQRNLSGIIAQLEESLGGLKVVKAFGAEQYQREKFSTVNEGYQTQLTRLFWRKDLSSPLSEFLGISIVAVLIWYGFMEVQKSSLTIPAFLTFLYAFYSVIEPSKSFSTAYYNIQKGMAALTRVNLIINEENSIVDCDNPIEIQEMKQGISFENVSFAYSEKNVLKNINLHVPKGKVLALVGSSGGGKSTLVDLLPRFYDVSHGGIKIDGIDIRELKLKELRNLFGIVTQDAILFNDSIYNNIVFGLENVDRADVIQAAKIANAHEFIEQSPEGYQTNIGDRGLKLSGGQRQRLTIARAILRDPSILILDEATSALDSESEQLVQEAIENIMKNRTAIVIAHRLSTIQHADEILVLKNGEIIERGKHAELLSEEGEYKKLVKMQAF